MAIEPVSEDLPPSVDPVLQRVADKLKALRKRERITQQILARRMGVHRNTVSHMERYPGQISLSLLAKAEAALHLGPWEILRGKKRAHDAVHGADSALIRSPKVP